MVEDFNKCEKSHLMKDYDRVLLWCKIFLYFKSFTGFKGSGLAYCLLFPMEKLFEEYVALILAKKFRHRIQTQHKGYSLLEFPKRFNLIPDIYLPSKNIIMDTKWKIINSLDDISQSDLYQMFAYLTKYKSNNVVLIYPYTGNVNDNRCYFDKKMNKN
ncbi:MAG: hypothetical protein FXF49_11480 [Flexistipes sinusarabici]|uniref:McrBC 5-methylcytosine restriction system component n=1 Tax=Flexistipes sinusarabici TaxID=2352 RepID=A0A5D0MJ92_FLESI|nr:MAG: hypothetical protein FXF49_11480 [Flexistipes sinusarabici]